MMPDIPDENTLRMLGLIPGKDGDIPHMDKRRVLFLNTWANREIEIHDDLTSEQQAEYNKLVEDTNKGAIFNADEWKGILVALGFAHIKDDENGG